MLCQMITGFVVVMMSSIFVYIVLQDDLANFVMSFPLSCLSFGFLVDYPIYPLMGIFVSDYTSGLASFCLVHLISFGLIMKISCNKTNCFMISFFLLMCFLSVNMNSSILFMLFSVSSLSVFLMMSFSFYNKVLLDKIFFSYFWLLLSFFTCLHFMKDASSAWFSFGSIYKSFNVSFVGFISVMCLLSSCYIYPFNSDFYFVVLENWRSMILVNAMFILSSYTLIRVSLCYLFCMNSLSFDFFIFLTLIGTMRLCFHCVCVLDFFVNLSMSFIFLGVLSSSAHGTMSAICLIKIYSVLSLAMFLLVNMNKWTMSFLPCASASKLLFSFIFFFMISVIKSMFYLVSGMDTLFKPIQGYLCVLFIFYLFVLFLFLLNKMRFFLKTKVRADFRLVLFIYEISLFCLIFWFYN
uniref:F-ORF n=1 Tax=Perumytilus purpuratus TaxID=390823 RepID=A0A346JF94_PERPP|nr:f-ORF [Perumytilus purpuratus]AXP32169.1 f-ORF [Perumytilus purpuratus]AXP84557.1 f-ORF [Perumytilus purpuratus]